VGEFFTAARKAGGGFLESPAFLEVFFFDAGFERVIGMAKSL
jgi:hypothetical protein